MITNFDFTMKNLLADEGGYVNDSNDAGGETKYGISKRAYPNEDIASLTEDRARFLYRRDYWDRFKGDAIISAEKASAIMSACVNFGVGAGVKLVQIAIGSKQDGIMGSNTIRQVNDMDPDKFLAMFSLAMIARYTEICKRKPSQMKFLIGWIARALRPCGINL